MKSYSDFLRIDNEKIRKVNRNLKRYTIVLEDEIKCLYGIDKCSGHLRMIDILQKQRD